eukprot:186602-Pelagomonas_calceolata.AAC.1
MACNTCAGVKPTPLHSCTLYAIATGVYDVISSCRSPRVWTHMLDRQPEALILPCQVLARWFRYQKAPQPGRILGVWLDGWIPLALHESTTSGMCAGQLASFSRTYLVRKGGSTNLKCARNVVVAAD